jgi:hypothetical protein
MQATDPAAVLDQTGQRPVYRTIEGGGKYVMGAGALIEGESVDTTGQPVASH